MFHYLYKITNLLNQKIYIGAHSSRKVSDNYMGSSKILRSSIKKYGKENFKKEILEFFESENEMYQKEAEIVNENFIKRKDTYNVRPGGRGGIKGYFNVQDIYGNKFQINDKNDPRYLSGEIFSIAKDTIKIRNLETNKLKCLNKLQEIPSGWEKAAGSGFLFCKKLNWIKNTKTKESKKIDKNEGLPLGWEWGRFTPEKSFSKVWIFNPETKETTRINKGEQIPKGWILGAGKYKKLKDFKHIWIVNLETGERSRIDINEPIPLGWIKGMKIKKNKLTN